MSFFSALFTKTDDHALTEAITDGAYLVDVRTPAEFSAGCVKGSVNIPLDKITSELSRFKSKKNIIVFCQSGNRSGQAKNILERNGVKNVINGGSWKKVSKLITQ